MTYTNGFTISANENECCITFLETIPGKKDAVAQEINTFVMNEKTARQMIAALAQIYAKIDTDRANKANGTVYTDNSQVN